MFKILSVFAILISFKTFSCDIDGKTGVFPESDLRFSPAQNFSGIDESEFNKILKEFEDSFRAFVNADNKKIEIKGKWKKNSVNAMTRLYKNTVDILVYGGLARAPYMTRDGIMMVLCHELGHHYGGAPKETSITGKRKYMNGEGQADYWASLKCFRMLYGNVNNRQILQGVQIPEVVTNKCQENFTNDDEVALCERSSLAALAMAKSAGTIPGSDEISYDTPDPNVTPTTYHQHPEAQCRLDTIFEGSLCTIDKEIRVDNVDPNIGACNRQESYKTGLRPLCWYNPNS